MEHCENILDCTYDTLGRTMDTVKKISNHLTDECGYDGLGGAGQWSKFTGAKFEIETMHKKLTMIDL